MRPQRNLRPTDWPWVYPLSAHRAVNLHLRSLHTGGPCGLAGESGG